MKESTRGHRGMRMLVVARERGHESTPCNSTGHQRVQKQKDKRAQWMRGHGVLSVIWCKSIGHERVLGHERVQERRAQEGARAQSVGGRKSTGHEKVQGHRS